MAKKPNHYSVEDMVKAAQTKSETDSSNEKKNETREVVVQEDGTKVVKVRRRKRKSGDPNTIISNSEAEKKGYVKMLLLTLLAGFICALILAAILFFRIASFNSPDHVTKIEDSLSHRLRSKVGLEGYRLGPTSSQLNKLKISSGIEEYPYANVELKDVKLVHRVENVILNNLKGSEAVAAEGKVSILYDREVEAETLSVDAPEAFPINYKDLEIDKLSFLFGEKRDSFSITESQGKLIKRDSDGKFQLIAKEGIVNNLNGFPKHLETANIVNEEEHLNIQSLKFSDLTVGRMEINGLFSKVTELPQSLSCNFNDLRLETLSPHLNELLEARVNTTGGKIMISPKEKQFRVETDVSVQQGSLSLKKFQFLQSVEEKFERFGSAYISFNTTSDFTFIIDNDKYEFRNISFEKQPALRVEGDFSVDHKGNLSGDLKVGVPTGKILKQYPTADSSLFKTDGRGYTMFDVTLSGTAKKPTDNFSKKFDEVVDALR